MEAGAHLGGGCSNSGKDKSGSVGHGHGDGNTRHMLKVETTGLAAGLNEAHERKRGVKDDFMALNVSN